MQGFFFFFPHEKRENINQAPEIPAQTRAQLSVSGVTEISRAREGTKTLQQLNQPPNSFSFGQPKEKPPHPTPHWGLIHFHMDRTTQGSPERQKKGSKLTLGRAGVSRWGWGDSSPRDLHEETQMVLPEGDFHEKPPALCSQLRDCPRGRWKDVPALPPQHELLLLPWTLQAPL